jgi:hypothetical protein
MSRKTRRAFEAQTRRSSLQDVLRKAGHDSHLIVTGPLSDRELALEEELVRGSYPAIGITAAHQGELSGICSCLLTRQVQTRGTKAKRRFTGPRPST